MNAHVFEKISPITLQFNTSDISFLFRDGHVSIYFNFPFYSMSKPRSIKTLAATFVPRIKIYCIAQKH